MCEGACVRMHEWRCMLRWYEEEEKFGGHFYVQVSILSMQTCSITLASFPA